MDVNEESTKWMIIIYPTSSSISLSSDLITYFNNFRIDRFKPIKHHSVLLDLL
jgi:hypothetical protein